MNQAYLRDRKRNFVTARTGMFAVFVMFLSTIVFNVVYNFEYWTSNAYTLDSSTKAWIISLYGMVFNCIINPCVLLVNAPIVQNAIHKWKMQESIHNIFNKGR